MEGSSPLQTSSSSIVVLESVDSLTWDPSPFLAIILLPGGEEKTERKIHKDAEMGYVKHSLDVGETSNIEGLLTVFLDWAIPMLGGHAINLQDFKLKTVWAGRSLHRWSLTCGQTFSCYHGRRLE